MWKYANAFKHEIKMGMDIGIRGGKDATAMGRDFKFTGWHHHCRCRATTILKTEEEMAEDTERVLAGERFAKESANTVPDVPEAFKGWVRDNADRIERAKSLPYFLKDNQKRVDTILGKATTTAKPPAEAAAERHAQRDPEAIRQAWNERRIANIRQAIAGGYLPEECAEGLSSLPQEQFNERIAFLQKRATAHATRTSGEIQAIKEAWAKRIKETERMEKNRRLKFPIRSATVFSSFLYR